MLNDILIFFFHSLSFSLGRRSGRWQPDCLCPLVGDLYLLHRAFTNLHQWQRHGQEDVWRKKHDEIWRKCRVEKGTEVVRWRGGKKSRKGEGREGGREGERERGSVNSCFLIKQQCSQLIHLICQLEEKHGRNLFTWEKGGRRGWRRGSYSGKKSKKKPREEARRGGIAVKEAEAIIEKEKPGCRGKDMNVVNGRGGKMEEKRRRRRGGEREDRRGREGCRVAKSVLAARVWVWPVGGA